MQFVKRSMIEESLGMVATRTRAPPTQSEGWWIEGWWICLSLSIGVTEILQR